MKRGSQRALKLKGPIRFFFAPAALWLKPDQLLLTRSMKSSYL